MALPGSESDAKETGFFKENADQLRGKGRRPRIPFLNFINKQKELADLYNWTSLIVSNTDLKYIFIEALRTSAVVIVHSFAPSENKNSDQEE